MTKADLADMLERFLGDAPGGRPYDWDDFTSTRASADLEPYRQLLCREENQPPGNEQVVRQVIAELRATSAGRVS